MPLGGFVPLRRATSNAITIGWDKSGIFPTLKYVHLP
jgi:hypothetical protein